MRLPPVTKTCLPGVVVGLGPGLRHRRRQLVHDWPVVRLSAPKDKTVHGVEAQVGSKPRSESSQQQSRDVIWPCLLF